MVGNGEGGGRDPGKIRAPPGLREELAPDVFSTENTRKKPALLLFATAGENSAATQIETHRKEVGAMKGLDIEVQLLLEKDTALDLAATQAAIFFRPGDRRVTFGRLFRQKASRPPKAALEIEYGTGRDGFDIFSKPGTNLCTEFRLFRCIIEIHSHSVICA